MESNKKSVNFFKCSTGELIAEIRQAANAETDKSKAWLLEAAARKLEQPFFANAETVQISNEKLSDSEENLSVEPNLDETLTKVEDKTGEISLLLTEHLGKATKLKTRHVKKLDNIFGNLGATTHILSCLSARKRRQICSKSASVDEWALCKEKTEVYKNETPIKTSSDIKFAENLTEIGNDNLDNEVLGEVGNETIVVLNSPEGSKNPEHEIVLPEVNSPGVLNSLEMGAVTSILRKNSDANRESEETVDNAKSTGDPEINKETQISNACIEKLSGAENLGVENEINDELPDNQNEFSEPVNLPEHDDAESVTATNFTTQNENQSNSTENQTEQTTGNIPYNGKHVLDILKRNDGFFCKCGDKFDSRKLLDEHFQAFSARLTKPTVKNSSISHKSAQKRKPANADSQGKKNVTFVEDEYDSLDDEHLFEIILPTKKKKKKTTDTNIENAPSSSTSASQIVS